MFRPPRFEPIYSLLPVSGERNPEKCRPRAASAAWAIN